VQLNQEPFGNEHPLQKKKPPTAQADEASRGMANEGCPNDLIASVTDATGYSGADDATERQ
jgi:hypothetical protein